MALAFLKISNLDLLQADLAVIKLNHLLLVLRVRRCASALSSLTKSSLAQSLFFDVASSKFFIWEVRKIIFGGNIALGLYAKLKDDSPEPVLGVV